MKAERGGERLVDATEIVLHARPLDTLLIDEIERMTDFERERATGFCIDMVAEIMRMDRKFDGTYIYRPPDAKTNVGRQVLSLMGTFRFGPAEEDMRRHEKVPFPYEPIPELMDRIRYEAGLQDQGEQLTVQYLTADEMDKRDEIAFHLGISQQEAVSQALATGLQYLEIHARGNQWGHKARKIASIFESQYNHHDAGREVDQTIY